MTAASVYYTYTPNHLYVYDTDTIYIHTSFSVPDKSKEPESKQFVGLVIGILTTVIVMLLAAIMFIFYRNRRLKAALAPSNFYDQQGDLKVIIKINYRIIKHCRNIKSF